MKVSLSSDVGRRLVVSCALAALLPSANAFQFALGELKGSFDTTVSAGALYRLRDPNPQLYGTTNSFGGIFGQQTSVNTDDGNLNYGRGVDSEIFKASHDLELHYRDYGALIRGYYFTDVKADDTLRTPLSDQAKDRVVRGAEWLDMYAFAKFNAGDMPVNLRVGRQVLSLGESTFIPNGMNVINPADLGKLRVPGSELKEALLPVNMIKASIGLTKDLTVEPFWLLEFRRNELEPAGSLFSTNDFASRGGRTVWLGFGTINDLSSTLGGIPRTLDREGNNFSQWGVASHYQAHALNDADIGVYYAKYHSRSPVLSAITPTSGVNPDLTGPLTIALVRGGLDSATASAQAAGIFQLIVLSQTNPGALTPTQLATLQAPSTQAAINGAKQIALLQAAATARYQVSYPEDINMFGLSFNTSLGATGISWQGEVSYKRDVPLQVDDVELLFAALSSLSPTFGAPNNQIGSYLGQYNTLINGYRRHKVWTAQSTLTKVFGPTLGSQQFTLVGEVGAVFADLPAKDVLRYDGQGTFSSGNPAAMVNTGNPNIPPTPYAAFADRVSAGGQIFGRFEYNNVFANVNMAPSFAFTYDFHGNTPLPLGNYVRDRKSVNVAVEFTYKNAWSLELRYVNFYDGGRYNLLNDRDYVASTLKYSF